MYVFLAGLLGGTFDLLFSSPTFFVSSLSRYLPLHRKLLPRIVPSTSLVLFFCLLFPFFLVLYSFLFQYGHRRLLDAFLCGWAAKLCFLVGHSGLRDRVEFLDGVRSHPEGEWELYAICTRVF